MLVYQRVLLEMYRDGWVSFVSFVGNDVFCAFFVGPSDRQDADWQAPRSERAEGVSEYRRYPKAPNPNGPCTIK